MTGKIFRSIIAAAGGVLLACCIILFGCLYEYFGNVQTDQLWAELELAAAGVEAAGMDYLNTLDKDSNRLTWIAADGAVLYDAQANQREMENHAGREEVQEALQSGSGTSARYSNTLLEKTVYCARRLSDGSVLRISVSRATMAVLAFGMLQPICAVVLIALILALFLANRLAQRIVEPLNRLDLDHPLENHTYDEIAPLLTRISQQRNQIDRQLHELQQKKDEFAQITSSMNEGLVLLDHNDCLLSINPAASRLFHTDARAIGQDFLTVERTPELSDALDSAIRSGHSEITLRREGRTYQIDISRILSEGATIGVVLLAFDVTEKIDAERSRREFTANVSHELKTPLTTVLCSSELLQAGMVKSEDVPRFATHIHNEAARLLTLIEDIIRLSQLDEGVELPKETIDLAEVAGQAVEQLREKAEQAQVSLHLEAVACPLPGVPRLFQEIVCNLIDNAIKYNVTGGEVRIRVTGDGCLTVADTGIGIPADQQQRVFERFYRVDKSHSKQIGGTGLGLSIVKHAAAYLGAKIELESQPGKGTRISLRFPQTP